KEGTGIMTLSGANTFTGLTTVEAGTLIVDGSIAGPATVEDGTLVVDGSVASDVTVKGGRLEGIGRTGGLTVQGGVFAPGNSIGTMTVNGNFALTSGGVYEVEVDASGNSDKTIVFGTVNLASSSLNVLAETGSYNQSTEYIIIENDGTDAVAGTFASISTDLAFLTPSVIYDGDTGNDVVLTLERNDTMFTDVADDENEEAVAGALDETSTDDSLFNRILGLSAAGARQAFNALSGEIHASVTGTLADASRYAREAVMGRMVQAGHQGRALGRNGPQSTEYVASHEAAYDDAAYDDGAYRLGVADTAAEARAMRPAAQPVAFWTQGFGAWGSFEGDGNAATADRNLGGFISGMDAGLGGSWRVGVAGGASFSDVSVAERASNATTQTYHAGGYVNGDLGGVVLRAGGLWAWSEIETSRAVVFPGFYEQQAADYDAETGQVFGEIATPVRMGRVELESFAGLAYVSVETGGFQEKGGAEASLRSAGIDQTVGYATVGFRAATTAMWGNVAVTPRIEAAWMHAFDEVTPEASLAYATTGIGFDVAGVPLAEDSVLLDAGLDFSVTRRLSAGVSYSGQYADTVSDNAVKGRLTWSFN
ncbi:MAG: autotransporter domain-containing protein, partial [Pseudomonadota bacterium]